jgi:hypothetical protein
MTDNHMVEVGPAIETKKPSMVEMEVQELEPIREQPHVRPKWQDYWKLNETLQAELCNCLDSHFGEVEYLADVQKQVCQIVTDRIKDSEEAKLGPKPTYGELVQAVQAVQEAQARLYEHLRKLAVE